MSAFWKPNADTSEKLRIKIAVISMGKRKGIFII